MRLGETEQAEPILAGLGKREHGKMRIAAAVLRLAQDDLQAATAALAPVLARLRPSRLSAAVISRCRACPPRASSRRCARR